MQTASLQRGKTPLRQTYVLDMTLNHLMVRFWVWTFNNVKYPFTAITSGSTLIQSGITCLGFINGSNRNIQPFTILESICLQANI